MFAANDIVSILRGSKQSEFGDEEDSDRAVKAHVPMSIIEQRRHFYDQQTGRSSQTTWLEGLINPNEDVQQGDRILSEKNGKIYVIDTIVPGDAGLPMMKDPTILDLRELG